MKKPLTLCVCLTPLNLTGLNCSSVSCHFGFRGQFVSPLFSSPLLPFFAPPAVILEKQIRIPRSLSVKAASVLKGFLNKVRDGPVPILNSASSHWPLKMTLLWPLLESPALIFVCPTSLTLSLASYLCLVPSSPTVSHPSLTLTPTGSQGASRLPPSDRLRRHHGSSVLPKRRLGPCELFTLCVSLFSSLNYNFNHDLKWNTDVCRFPNKSEINPYCVLIVRGKKKTGNCY